MWKNIFAVGQKSLRWWSVAIEIVVGICSVFFSVILLQASLKNFDWNYGWSFVKDNLPLSLISMIVLAIVLAWLTSLLGSFIVADVIFLAVITTLSVATKIKMEFRKETVYPEDLKMFDQLGLFKDIVGSKLIYFIIGLFIILGILCIFFIWRSFKFSKKLQVIRVASFFVMSGLLLLLANFNTINSPVKKVIVSQVGDWILWDQTQNYIEKGYVPGFLFNMKSKAMEKPKNYSKETVLEIVEKYQNMADENNASVSNEQPNIVYIMNESFSDMERLKGIELSEDPIKEYREIADNTFSGFMVSPQYGGGTANVEFEALTSFSMALLNPQISVPYSSLIPNYTSFPSIVSYLDSQNYDTLAIHPFNTSMYKRKDVYKTLGFDNFLSAENTLFYDERKDGMYYSDYGAYGVTYEKLESDENPQFIHLVTMQNHSPYTSPFSTKEYSVNGETTGELANYAQAAHESSLAIQEFLEKVKQLDRRTIIVFWGDHLPPIYSESILNQNDEITKFETPFMIYDSKNELEGEDLHSNLTSPIYFAGNVFHLANLKTSGFYELLSALEQYLPSFKRGDYFYNQRWNSDIGTDKELQQIYSELSIIQYDILSGNNYSQDAGFFD